MVLHSRPRRTAGERSDVTIAAPVPESHNPDSGPGSRPRRTSWIGWAGTAVVVAAMWPATIGGLTGFSVVERAPEGSLMAGGDLVVSLRQSGYAVGELVAYERPLAESASDAPGEDRRAVGRVADVVSTPSGVAYVVADTADGPASGEAVSSADVVGRVVMRIPGAGYALDPVVVPYATAAVAGTVAFVVLRLARRGRPLGAAG